MLGSFTEELVNKTIEWYLDENIAYFKKSYPAVTVLNKYTKTDCFSQIREKGDLDYYGVYGGKYVSFEVKETDKDYFLLSQIKPHQLAILIKLKEFKAISFLLLNFASYPDSCYLIRTEELENLINSNKKRIKYEEVSSIGTHLPISFPGVIDFLSIIFP